MWFIVGPLVIAEVLRFKNMTQPQPQQPAIPQAIEPMADRYEQSPMMAVLWRTPNADGMSPLGALQSTVKRMQYEQGTPLGNDQTAKALVKVLEAVAILEGRETKTEDGFPIIE
jgi:hypothetical protein